MDESQVYSALKKTFESPDPHSYGVYKMIQEIYPALAKKVFENNKLMERFVMTNYNPMDILQYPVCGKCESIAAWSSPVKRGKQYVRTCKCVKSGCGSTTVNPPTFRQWLMSEIKHKAPQGIEEELAQSVDLMADRLLNKLKRDHAALKAQYSVSTAKKMGLVLPGQEHEQKKLFIPGSEKKDKSVLYLTKEQYQARKSELDRLLKESKQED